MRDEVHSRCVRAVRRDPVGKRARQRRSERLAELHAPLVERVDAAEHALDERAVFVKGEQLTETARVELRQEQGRRRPIAGTDAVRRLRVDDFRRQAFGRELGTHHRQRFSDHQGLRLRQRVGDEQALLIAERMRRSHRHDEFDRHRVRALMQPLEERVLAVGARSTP